MNIACIPYPEQLTTVYTSYLQAVINASGAHLGPDARWKVPHNVQALSTSMVETYEKLKTTFSVDDHRHYLFNPRYVFVLINLISFISIIFNYIHIHVYIDLII